jgi:hypothetical protein
MTDLVKLIAADRPVHLMPDAMTAEELRKLDDFWSDKTADWPEQDLPAVSDQAMRAALAEDGIDADMPDAVRDVVQGRHPVPLVPLALAACLVGAVAIGSALWLPQISNGITAVPEKRPAAADPYVFARPDRPAAGAAPSQKPAPGSGLQVATVRSATGDVDDLTRAEVHEMQRLLTRLGYGPLVQSGLPTKALVDAMSRFRIDQGLDPGDLRPREGLVMLRLAARADALRAPRDGVPDR